MTLYKKDISCQKTIHCLIAPIAQLDRVTDCGSVGQRFESSWARQFSITYAGR